MDVLLVFSVWRVGFDDALLLTCAKVGDKAKDYYTATNTVSNQPGQPYQLEFQVRAYPLNQKK